MKERVVVGMSGGVDSSVAALLLKRQGYEVIGITMCFGLKEAGKKRPSCCGIEGIEDARRVAHKLGIRHYVLNFDKPLQEKVIKNFLREYFIGRTPNPCILCNQHLKFGVLLKKAKSLGARYLATGHYARISVSHKFLLKKAKDRKKDQSYFLYRLKQEQLKDILFPLSDYTKEEVRKLAYESDLPVAKKPASQEICFIPNDDYRGFLRDEVARLDINVEPGPILDTKEKIVGQHKGIPFYTVGQREGLGIAMGFPIYVLRIDVKRNTLIVGSKEEALSYGLVAGNLSFTAKAIKGKVVLDVMIRYNHKGVGSSLIPLGRNKVKIIFSKPQFAVTPGQAAVFYKGQELIGGGVIEKGIGYAKVN